MKPPEQNTMDLRPLVEDPQEQTEEFWRYAEAVAPELGTQVVNLCREKTNEYVDWVEHIEESHEAQLPLRKDIHKVKYQLRTRPDGAWPLEIPLIDYNTTALYMGSSSSLEAQAKGARRASAARAYSRLGAINQAEDLGLYMSSLLPGVLMKSPTRREQTEHENMTDWSVETLLSASDEAGSTYKPVTDSYVNLALREPHHQPGRLNFSTAILMEIGTYFLDKEGVIDGYGIYESDEIAEAAFAVAGSILSETEAEHKAAFINTIVDDELARRTSDIAFLDLHREAKHRLQRPESIERQYVAAQLDYIQKFRAWSRTPGANDGIGFEWVVPLMLRHVALKKGNIDSSYVHYAAPRSDYPEDDLSGNASSRKQAFDVLLDNEGIKTFIQCKTKGGKNKYVDPPITLLIAREVFGKQHSFLPLMDDYLRVANELEAIYTNKKEAQSDSYLDAELTMLQRLGQ